MEKHQTAVYNVLHGDQDMGEGIESHEVHDYEDDHDDDHLSAHKHHKHEHKKEVVESFDFNDVESMMWRKVWH